ncbi:MAG TPA: DUF1697 domain-containing protein [Cytophagaceae bacterium]|jgi:uncharacterized protein (DUF1697 family)|nr:DUF1697 domain-containing protein [Cytophagaceae bacterium]
MEVYIAILRGINVSGHNLIKMDALRSLCKELGFRNAKTYIQSGNIVFQYKKISCDSLEKKIEQAIFTSFSFKVPVLVKEAVELTSVLQHNPFVNVRMEDETKLHVTFLSKEPDKGLVDKIKEGSYAADECIFSGRNVYLFCPNGYGNTKLHNGFFESKLKVTATTRNWKTLNELAMMAESISKETN